MAKKHLVLDHDVYLRLQKRKKATGIAQQSLGNMILRSVLSQPNLLIEVVGRKLADSGAIQLEEYNEAVLSAIRDIRQAATEGSTLLETGPGNTLVSGSWEVRPLYRSPDGSFQVVEVGARNARKKPIAYHVHSEDEYMLVLSGSVLLEDTGRHMLLDSGSCCRIQRGSIHSAVPLGEDVQALTTFVPAGPLFSQSGATDR